MTTFNVGFVIFPNSYERRNQMDTSNSMILEWFWI
jgi:hypothetical protein